ncbi:MAG TPA: site-specific integrase [Rhodocyclaceae bacterium]|nr:site-specific integrase [Rhodocyclaceae bacterium]
MATIKRRGDFQWRAQIRRKGHPAQSKTFETREAAEKWARSIERERDQGLYINRSPAEKNTLGDILTRYLEEIVPEHKGAEVEKIRIRALLRAQICQLSMAALTPAALAEWRDARLLIVSPATVRRDLDIISAAINIARKDWGFHMDNPVLAMRRPKPAKARERRLMSDEEARLLKALENEDRDAHGRLGSGTRNPWIKPLMQLAIETAMRRGELLSLRWENIELDHQTAYLEDTKNGESRTVPLSSAAVRILRALPRSISGIVFPITEDSIKKAFSRAVSRARKEYEEECQESKTAPDNRLLNLRFHDLRHEATSRIAEKLDNILELSAVTGHKDVRMLKRYYHPKASHLAKKLG